MENAENRLIIKSFIHVCFIALLWPFAKLLLADSVISFIWGIWLSKITNKGVSFILEFITLLISYYLAIAFFYKGFFSGRAYCGSVYMESIKFKDKFKRYFDFLSSSCKIVGALADNKRVSSVIPITINWILIFFVYNPFPFGGIRCR